jgi:adenine/guanine phosphoribosyltransferase-like PRPP-binding protein
MSDDTSHDLMFALPTQQGHLLAQSIARHSGLKFFYSEQGLLREGLFRAEYRMAPELSRQIQGERVALNDDVISGGSSVRATHAALEAAGAKTIVVAALMTLGTIGISHFASRDIAVEALARRVV